MSTDTMQPTAYTVDEVAHRAGCSPRTIRNNLWRMPGKFRVGRALRFDAEKVERALLAGNLFTDVHARQR